MEPWQKFLKVSLLSSIICVIAYFGLYFITDPYDRFFSDPSKIPVRPKVNERFFLPTLVSKNAFNSVILGTSTIQLVKPSQLNQLFNEKFLNIAMASATAYEQSKLFKLFLKSHPHPDTVIFGIDIVWCEDHPSKNASISYFPEFLFQNNALLDFKEALTQRTAEHCFTQLLVCLYLRKPFDRSDGYRSFLPSADKYSLSQARKHIYKQETPLAKPVYLENLKNSKSRFEFPQAHYMEEILASLPAETRKIIIFVPYHSYYQLSGGLENVRRWQACKHHYKEMALKFSNVHVIDFMIDSYITEKDENYWDPLHYNLQIAEKLGWLIYQAVFKNKADPAYLYYTSNKTK